MRKETVTKLTTVATTGAMIVSSVAAPMSMVASAADTAAQVTNKAEAKENLDSAQSTYDQAEKEEKEAAVKMLLNSGEITSSDAAAIRKYGK